MRRAQIWQVSWLHGVMERWLMLLAQMKQTSASSSAFSSWSWGLALKAGSFAGCCDASFAADSAWTAPAPPPPLPFPRPAPPREASPRPRPRWPPRPLPLPPRPWPSPPLGCDGAPLFGPPPPRLAGAAPSIEAVAVCNALPIVLARLGWRWYHACFWHRMRLENTPGSCSGREGEDVQGGE